MDCLHAWRRSETIHSPRADASRVETSLARARDSWISRGGPINAISEARQASVESYSNDLLIADALAMMDSCRPPRFHLPPCASGAPRTRPSAAFLTLTKPLLKIWVIALTLPTSFPDEREQVADSSRQRMQRRGHCSGCSLRKPTPITRYKLRFCRNRMHGQRPFANCGAHRLLCHLSGVQLLQFAYRK